MIKLRKALKAFKEFFEDKILFEEHTFQKVAADFKTTDGEYYTTKVYKWARATGLTCSVGEYLMIDINRDGYIQDEDGVMYPLANVISIEWKIVEEKVLSVSQSEKYCYKIFFSEELLLESTRKVVDK